MRRSRWAMTVGVLVAVVAVGCVPPSRPSQVRPVTPLATTCSTSAPTTPPTSITAKNRSVTLVAPANYQPGVEYPLLVSLHPFVLGPTEWEAYSGLAKAASQRGYWVLVPRGSDPGPRWAVPGGGDYGVDDISWIDAVLHTTSETVCVDGDRVFAAGFSAGAAMAMGLACELPGRFAAIAGSGGTNLTNTCPSGAPVDAMVLHGTADGFAPLTGSTQVFAPPLGLSVDAVIASLRTRNGCNATPTVIPFSATVTIDQYTCTTGRLEYWRMRGAGHTWAGSLFPLDIVTGPTDRSFSATTAVLDFFGVS